MRIIGVSCDVSEEGKQYTVNRAYVEYVEAAGFTPVVLNPNIDPMTAATMCDGLLLTGGRDIDPIHYGEMNMYCLYTCVERDDYERALLWAFVEKRKNVFGICRGFQLIAREVLLRSGKGFTFYQNVSGHSINSDRNIARYNPTHMVVADESLLLGCAETAGSFVSVPVNSMHHQALVIDSAKRISEDGDIKILAYTDIELSRVKHFLVEAADFKIDDVVLSGTQWHPEELAKKDNIHTSPFRRAMSFNNAKRVIGTGATNVRA